MHRIWQFFVQFDRFSYLLMVVLLGFGILSLVLIPKESSPEVQIPIGVISTVLPGAPASDVETLITNELERGLIGSLENVVDITSSSREGVSVITVEFEADADIDESIADLKDEVDVIKVDLPGNAEEPLVSEVNFVDQPIMSIAIGGEFTPEEITRLANQLEVEIESLPGVSRVNFSGVREREVTVVVDDLALERFDLSLSEVISGIQAANQTLPIGQIETDGVIYNIAFEGDINESSEVANLAVTTRGGQPVYLRDIAEVVDGLNDTTTLSRLSVDGEPSQQAMTMDVYKQRGGDITRIADSVNAQVAELGKPGGILETAAVKTTFDSGNDIKKDLVRLSSSGLQTVFLVILLLVVAIGWREGLVAGSAIPISFVIGFIGLYVSDNTINFISLFSLILVIGILVDSSIVMVEGINRRMKDNPNIDKRDAALATIKEFSTPIMTGTLTTVSMFSGLFLVSGVTGQFIANIPFTINFILFASLLVALGFIPLIAATFLRRRSQTRLEKLQVEKSRQLETWYRRKLEQYIDNPHTEYKFRALLLALFFFTITFPINFFIGLMAALPIYLLTYKLSCWQAKKGKADWVRFTSWLGGTVVILAIASIISFSFLPSLSLVRVIFFEQSDINWIYVEIEEPQGTAREITDISARRVEEVLYTHPDIASFVTTVGAGSVFAGGGQNEKLASFFINLREDRTLTSSEIIEELREDMAHMRDLSITIDQPSDGPPTGTPLVYRFLGDDLIELTTIAERSATLLKTIPGATNVTTTATNNSTEFVLTLDKAKAAALGLDPFSISRTLRTAVYGTDATTLTTLNEEIDVVVKLNLGGGEEVASDETNITNIETIKNLQLPTPTGETVLISSVADVTLRESSSVINHEGGERVVSVSGDITGEVTIPEINRQFQELLEREGVVPDTVTLQIGGETEESNQAFIEMFFALIVGVVLMVAVLTLQFNSFLHTRYVLTILPYSLIGIMAGLAITQLPLSFPSLMGFVALSGIVVNNSILLIDLMNQDRRRHPTKPIKEVVLDSASSRLRPILLTTMTTVVGMVPLTYASEIWSPLAWAIMFGLAFSVVITLILIPVIYHQKPGKINNGSVG